MMRMGNTDHVTSSDIDAEPADPKRKRSSDVVRNETAAKLTSFDRGKKSRQSVREWDRQRRAKLSFKRWTPLFPSHSGDPSATASAPTDSPQTAANGPPAHGAQIPSSVSAAVPPMAEVIDS